MSDGSSRKVQSSVEIVSIIELKETKGPRIQQIDQDHVDRLARSIEREGLLQAISVTKSDDEEYVYDIVDGRHRKHALRQLGVDEVAIYDVPGDRYWVVPTEEAEADVGIQSVAANALRNGLSQAEKGLYLKNEITEKIIEKMDEVDISKLDNKNDNSPANVRGPTDVPPARRILYHLDHIDENREDWKFADELYDELERVRFALDIGDPRTEAEYLQFYNESPPEVRNTWAKEEIGKSAVEHLRQIEQNDLREFALEKAKQGWPDGYSARDLESVRKAAEYDVASVNQSIINEEFSDLEDAVEQAQKKTESDADEADSDENNPDDSDLEQFEQQLEELSHLDQVRTVADWEGVDPTKVIRKCYQMNSEGKDYQRELNEKVDEIKAKKHQRERLRADRVESYSFENTPFERRNGNQTNTHKEAPLVLDEDGHILDAEDGFELDDFEVAVFFHDNIQMGLEVPDSLDDEDAPGFFHLMFFSPPYFDQSGSMPVDQWLPEGTIEITNEETLDATYESYLDWLIERLKVFTQKLKPGRALIVNISDISTANLSELDAERFGSAPEKRYNIPADLSARVRKDIENLRYDSTIQWMRQQTTSQRGGQYWSTSSADKSGYPLYYYPQDATEELLIFRKMGKPDHSAIRKEAMSRFDREFTEGAEFRTHVGFDTHDQPFNNCLDELVGDFDDPRNNVWKIAPQTDAQAHEAAFPRKLARLVIKLFTLPGERVADPFGGYTTTLREVQKVNADQPELPNRQGFAWENFSSEQVGQEDYRKEVYEVLAKSGIVGFRQPL